MRLAWTVLAVSAVCAPMAAASMQEQALPVDPVVYFKLGSARLSSSSRETIHRTALQAKTATRVRVVGHADSSGAAEFNLWLSMRRTQAVVNELIKDGVPKGILIADWRGEYEPAAADEPSGFTQANRRVVISVEQ